MSNPFNKNRDRKTPKIQDVYESAFFVDFCNRLGARGGEKGGPARARNLSPQRRTDIARKAANARWKREAVTNA
jgi:hypothetical protein